MDMVNHKCGMCGGPCGDFRITCGSRGCHEAFVKAMEEVCGKDKIVEDVATGKRYRVPTRFIIEEGLKHSLLQLFPRVDNEQ